MNKIKYPDGRRRMLENATHSMYYFLAITLVLSGVLIGIVINLPNIIGALHYVLLIVTISALTFSVYFLVYWITRYRVYKKENF